MKKCFTVLFTVIAVILLAGLYMKKISESDGILMKVSRDPAKGFSWDYYLYIPETLQKEKSAFLLVEPNNTGTTSDDLSVHNEKAENSARSG